MLNIKSTETPDQIESARPRAILSTPPALAPAQGPQGPCSSATKEMQKGHPRVAFFTLLFLAERGSA